MAFSRLILKKKEQLSETCYLLSFVPKDGATLDFSVGQYLNLSISSLYTRSYSIASLPGDEFLSFAIRTRGKLSGYLCAMKVGGECGAEGPHGNFCPTLNYDRIVFLAAGIGIAPFVVWYKALKAKKSHAKLSLLYSSAKRDDAPYLSYFKQEAEDYPDILTLTQFFTQEQRENCEGVNARRIATDDLGQYVDGKEKTCFAICGSSSFTYTMWGYLKQLGVTEEDIVTEAFF